jgi:hypothetical protein
MRKWHRLRFIALLLPLVLPFAWLSSGPAPLPRPANKAVLRRIQAAFDKIRPGMTEEELSKLMAPFQNVSTGHGQWPRWTDGQFVIDLTLDISEFILMGRPIRVLEGELSEKRLDEQGTHWVRVRRLGDTDKANAVLRRIEALGER